MKCRGVKVVLLETSEFINMAPLPNAPLISCCTKAFLDNKRIIYYPKDFGVVKYYNFHLSDV